MAMSGKEGRCSSNIMVKHCTTLTLTKYLFTDKITFTSSTMFPVKIMQLSNYYFRIIFFLDTGYSVRRGMHT
jgi:hypothetical protein